MTKEEFIQTLGEQFGDRRFVAALGEFIITAVEQPFPERMKRGQAWSLPLHTSNEVLSLPLKLFVRLGAGSWYVDSSCLSWDCIWATQREQPGPHSFVCGESEGSVVPLVRLTIPWGFDRVHKCRSVVICGFSWCLWCREEQDCHQICYACLEQLLELVAACLSLIGVSTMSHVGSRTTPTTKTCVCFENSNCGAGVVKDSSVVLRRFVLMLTLYLSVSQWVNNTTRTPTRTLVRTHARICCTSESDHILC